MWNFQNDNIIIFFIFAKGSICLKFKSFISQTSFHYTNLQISVHPETFAWSDIYKVYILHVCVRAVKNRAVRHVLDKWDLKISHED